MKVRVTNIQKFSLQDGPGIRTTVFLKGCSIRCPWCSNPENIEYKIQEYSYNGKSGCYGYDIDLDSLYNEIMKDKDYYKVNNGGVTFSGGEALLQFDKLEPLLRRLKDEGINICVETSLFAPTEQLDIALKYVDEFIVDIKILDEELCKKILNGNIELYNKNMDLLFSKTNNVMFRIPVTKEYTFISNNIKKIEMLLKKYTVDCIEVFTVHRLGEEKYHTLNMECRYFGEVKSRDMDSFVRILKKYCKNVKINRI